MNLYYVKFSGGILVAAPTEEDAMQVGRSLICDIVDAEDYEPASVDYAQEVAPLMFKDRVPYRSDEGTRFTVAELIARGKVVP